MKHNIAVIGSIITGIAIIGLIGSSDRQVELESAMQATCETAAHTNSPSLSDSCISLIHEVESSYHYEVLSNDQGQYWTEYHK